MHSRACICIPCDACILLENISQKQMGLSYLGYYKVLKTNKLTPVFSWQIIPKSGKDSLRNCPLRDSPCRQSCGQAGHRQLLTTLFSRNDHWELVNASNLAGVWRKRGVSMRYILVRCVTILLLSAALVSAVAQTTTNPTPQAPANPAAPTRVPEMVCWGNGPHWSIQFASWGARYLGISQPDQTFRGHLYSAPEDKAWVWQRTSGVDPSSGPALSAVIKETSCTDTVQKKIYPYSAQVSLPQGDTVSGCCRKLKAGEAPIGPQGVPSNDTPNPSPQR